MVFLLRNLSRSVPGWFRRSWLAWSVLLYLAFSRVSYAQGADLSSLTTPATTDAQKFAAVLLPFLAAIAVFAILMFVLYSVLQLLNRSNSD
mgnify:CR=1 FL=1